MTVYKNKQYAVYNVGSQYIIHNQDYKFAEKHTHIETLETCKLIISNLLKKKIPKTKNKYLLTSYIRIAGDEKYKKDIQNLLKKQVGVKK